ncbi:MAG: hypothetical protein AB8B91_16905, partial [Rubripirellula sp.]
MRNLLFLVSVGFLAAISTGFAVAEDDQVYLKRGGGISGSYKGSTAAQIAIESKGQNQTVNVNEIRTINFADEPTELRQGRAKSLSGKFDSALSDLKRVNPSSIERDVIKRDLQFFLALCEAKIALSAGGDKAKANASMMSFVKAAPRSFH